MDPFRAEEDLWGIPSNNTKVQEEERKVYSQPIKNFENPKLCKTATKKCH